VLLFHILEGICLHRLVLELGLFDLSLKVLTVEGMPENPLMKAKGRRGKAIQ